jgi:hypothetical protein
VTLVASRRRAASRNGRWRLEVPGAALPDLVPRSRGGAHRMSVEGYTLAGEPATKRPRSGHDASTDLWSMPVARPPANAPGTGCRSSRRRRDGDGARARATTDDAHGAPCGGAVPAALAYVAWEDRDGHVAPVRVEIRSPPRAHAGSQWSEVTARSPRRKIWRCQWNVVGGITGGTRDASDPPGETGPQPATSGRASLRTRAPPGGWSSRDRRGAADRRRRRTCRPRIGWAG